MTPAHHVGIVVIGRNEAPRLRRCLESVRNGTPPVVYVDSGSSDGSADIAERLGVRTIRLTAGPHTAARGRQVGFEELSRRDPALKYVQFVDGDCTLLPGWIERATAFLDAHDDVAVVVGRLREQHARKSLLIRLVDADWDLPTGETDAIGGISLMRAGALRDVGGWRCDLIAGEELDLGARIRDRGGKLHRLPDDMTLHDIGIRNVGELWRRSVRSGFAYAQLALLHGRSRCRRWARRALGNVAYGALLPLLLVVLAPLWWPAAAFIAALYVLLVVRVVHHRLRRGDTLGFALLYALVLLGQKVAGALGTLKLLLNGLSGKRPRIIEYKSAVGSAGS